MDFGQMAQAYLASTQPAPVAPAAASPGDAMIELFVGGIEIAGTGGALAYLNATCPSEGKTHHELFGVPTDAAVAVGGIGLGIILALFGSRAYGHVLRVGFGALVETGIRYALEKGVEHREAAKEKQITTAAKKRNLHLIEQQRRGFSSTQPAPATQFTQTQPAVSNAPSQRVFQPVG